MTLEDFFTLTEMRDGLSSLARVGELVLVIQNLKDPDKCDVMDALRQWSTVASTLMVTKNEECLNQFISLNGDSFLNKWLQKALNFSEDTGSNVVEELINSLLESFEKLPIDIERANASGIVVTIKHLLNHKCLQIKDKARILFDKWNLKTNDNDGGNDLVIEDACQREETRNFEDTQMVDISECNKTGEKTCEGKNASIEFPLSDSTTCLESSQRDSKKNEMMYTLSQILPSDSLNCTNATTALGDVDSSGPSLASNCNQESSSVIKDSSSAVEDASGVTYISHSHMEGVTDGKPEGPLLKDAAHSMKGDIIPFKSDQKDIHNSLLVSAPSVPESVQMADAGPIMSSHVDSKGIECCLAKTVEPQGKDGLSCPLENCSTTEETKTVGHVVEGNKDSHAIGRINATDVSQSFHHTMEAVKNVGATKEFPFHADLKKVVKKDVMSADSFKTSEGKCSVGISQKSEFGIIDDALEVARQVAIAVEREVVDYREPFCSSPEVNSTETGGVCSLDSKGDEQHQAASREVSVNGSPSGNEAHSGSESSTKETSEITQNLSSDLEKSEEDLESPKPNTSIQESVGRSDRGKCDLDLNVDIQSDELESLMESAPDIPVNLSTPLPIIASSKGVPVLPVIPLHFEGELGWKGCAATSAFRPASPRRTPESEKTQSGSRQNSSNFFQIDLNVADCEAEVVVEPILLTHLHASVGLPSGDSSMEVSSIKGERLKFDLNCLGDEDVPTYISSNLKIAHQIVEQNMSSASSSAKQCSVRDFDLNDNLNFNDVGGSHYDKSSSKSSNRYGGSKLDDPVISLMGSTVPPERKGFANQVQQPFLSNRLNMDPSAGTRPALPYDKLPPGIHSYTGIPNGPGMSMSQPFYTLPGSIPYMVSPGGPAVFPQVTSSDGFNGAPSARPPLLLNISNEPSSSFGFEALRPGFDLNSGTTSGDTGNQVGGLKQFFWQGHGGLVDPQTKGTQPSSSSITPKRKEPECGWDSYPFGYKRMTS